MKRCFVALGLPEETRAALSRVQDGLRGVRAGAARRVRPVTAANLHVTMKFLGPTTDEQVPELTDALRGVAREARPGAATLRGVDAFPSRTRPRVIIVTLDAGREPVIELAEAIEQACAALGFPAERRAHVPHVTLARIEQAKSGGPLTTWIDSAPSEPLGAVDTSRLILFESVLRPGGAAYTPLATLPLGTA